MYKKILMIGIVFLFIITAIPLSNAQTINSITNNSNGNETLTSTGLQSSGSIEQSGSFNAINNLEFYTYNASFSSSMSGYLVAKNNNYLNFSIGFGLQNNVITETTLYFGTELTINGISESYYNHITISNGTATRVSISIGFTISFPLTTFISSNGTYDVSLSSYEQINLPTSSPTSLTFYFNTSDTTAGSPSNAIIGHIYNTQDYQSNPIPVFSFASIYLNTYYDYINDYTISFIPSIPSGQQQWYISYSASSEVNLYVNGNEVITNSANSFYDVNSASGESVYWGAPDQIASSISISYTITQKLAYGTYTVNAGYFNQLIYNGGNLTLNTNNFNEMYFNSSNNNKINEFKANNMESGYGSYYVNFSSIYSSGYGAIFINNIGYLYTSRQTNYVDTLVNLYNNTVITVNSNYALNRFTNGYNFSYNFNNILSYSFVQSGISEYNISNPSVVEKTYPVYFNFSQIPAGSPRSITVNNHIYTSDASSIEVNLTTGQFSYTAQYGSLIGSGSVIVSGDYSTYYTNVKLHSQSNYYVNIYTNNYNALYNGIISGNTYSIHQPLTSIQLFNGTYTYNIPSIYGYEVNYPTSFTINGKNISIYDNFTLIGRYLTFTRSGLSNILWNIAVDNKDYSTSGNEIQLLLLQTTYNYSVEAYKNYTQNILSGSIDLTSNSSINIIYTNIQHTLTINVIGFTQNYVYEFTINSNTYYFSGSTNIINIDNGTYNYAFNFNQNYTWNNGQITITGNAILNENINVKVYHLIFISTVSPYYLTLNGITNSESSPYYYNTTDHNLAYSASIDNFVPYYSQSSLNYSINQTITITFKTEYTYFIYSNINIQWSIVFNNKTYTSSGINPIEIQSNNSAVQVYANSASGLIPEHYIYNFNTKNYTDVVYINYISDNSIIAEQNSFFALLPYFIVFSALILIGIVGFIRSRRND
jgi:hypothetical protein